MYKKEISRNFLTRVETRLFFAVLKSLEKSHEKSHEKSLKKNEQKQQKSLEKNRGFFLPLQKSLEQSWILLPLQKASKKPRIFQTKKPRKPRKNNNKRFGGDVHKR